MPHEVWLTVGVKARTPAIGRPPIRVVRLSEAPLSAGVETHLDHGVPLRVFSTAKTSRTASSLRGKVGTDVAVAALRDGWRQQRFTIDELWHFAGVCRFAAVMRGVPGGARRVRPVANVAASVRQRLLNEAKRRGESFDYVASLFARERFLARLSLSPHRDRLTLKGTTVFAV